jgi:hypothetical protein
VTRRKGLRAILVAAAAILCTLLLAGCGSATDATQAQQLMQKYPWLASLGLSVLEWLIQTYGSDIAALLAAAALALA